MRDKKVRELFEQELEIPGAVRDKMKEAYREIGADMEKIEMSETPSYTRRHSGRRYLKAASIMLCFLIAAASVSAATGGDFAKLGKLSKLFGGDVKQIESSSVKPIAAPTKNTFKNLEVTVQEVTGAEDLSYVVLKLKRTDGKTFKRGEDYSFGIADMIGEDDLGDGYAGLCEDEKTMPGAGAGSGAFAEYRIVGDKEEEGKLNYIGENRFVNPGIVIENNGTDEIYMAVSCGYVRNDETGDVYYHRGENCRLFLKDFCGNSGEDILMKGVVETEFKLDYGESEKKVCEPEQKIQLPEYGTEKYVSAGTLNRVTITPYFIKYECSMSEKESRNNTWEQVYLEFDDGTYAGCQTFEQYQNDLERMAGYGCSVGVVSENESKAENSWKETRCIPVKTLIDVNRVKAIYFGETRIEL